MNRELEARTQALEPAAQVAATVAGDDVTHVIFILDRSGSMGGKEADVIGGVNSYVSDLRRTSEGGVVGISYVRFDQQIELVWNDVPLADVPTMTPEHYSVRGSTALLDAVGMTVPAINDNPAHRYVVITNTDGMENASREWTAERVKALIEERQARGNWTFTFFGEGIEAWSQAGRYGFAPNASMAHSAADRHGMFHAKARVTDVMMKRKMRATRDFARATRAVMRDESLSDDEVARILEGDEDADDAEK